MPVVKRSHNWSLVVRRWSFDLRSWGGIRFLAGADQDQLLLLHVRLLEEQRERFRRVRDCIAETVGKRSPIQRSLFDFRDSAMFA